MRYPVSVTKLLQVLPQFQDKWITVKGKQKVDDIIKEILSDHEEFKSHYDKIALYFDGNNTTEIADNIFYFLKNNIRYKEESVDDQTTSIPAGILTRGKGDCKHYAELAGGILDALKRRGKKINWYYRFASYDPFDDTPHHVFTVIYDRGQEILIDPTPGSESKIPFWHQDEHIKPNSMALRKNIAGINDSYEETIGSLDVFTLVSGLFNSLFGNFVIGDQVPDYPIKSKETLKGILDETMPQFPDAKSLSDAKALYEKALYYISVADDKIRAKAAIGKSTAVDETYKMIYQEIADTYLNYIDTYSNTNNPPAYPDNTSDDEYPPSMPGPAGPGDPPVPPKTEKKNDPLMMAALAAGGVFLITKMGKPKGPTRRKVSGFPPGVLLALVVGGAAYFVFNKGNSGPSTQKKREALIDLAQDENDTNSEQAFIDMTEDEVNTSYEAVFITTARPLPDGPLKTKLEAIIDKYNIFT